MTDSPDSAPILWLMGPTSAGKSTIARRLVERLRAGNRPAIHLDGDQVRDYFGDLIRFGADDRMRVVSALVDLARRTAEAGLVTVVAALTAHDDARRMIRDALPGAVVVYVKCPIEVCMDRDPKGLYKRAVDGEIETLIGYNETYDPPRAPEITVETDGRDVDDSVAEILDGLARLKQERP